MIQFRVIHVFLKSSTHIPGDVNRLNLYRAKINDVAFSVHLSQYNINISCRFTLTVIEPYLSQRNHMGTGKEKICCIFNNQVVLT